MHYFFIERPEAIGATTSLRSSDANQIKKVLRMSPGDRIGLFDGQGMAYEARIVSFSAESVDARITRRFLSAAEPDIDIVVGQAYLKQRKMDTLVRQLTELGVKKWIPFFAVRSVPRPDGARLAARRRRWQKITREALKQSKRGRFMQIGKPVSFDEALNLTQGCDLKIVFWEIESQPLASSRLQPQGQHVKKIFVMLGPEGGFTPAEIERVVAHGFQTATLGPRILRAETAAVAAVTLIQYLFGDMGKKILTKI
ncbi:MAG: 16S rRNA (uracil(1498)-N(3))-methyltransferase [Desulfobacterales bacterium]